MFRLLCSPTSNTTSTTSTGSTGDVTTSTNGQTTAGVTLNTLNHLNATDFQVTIPSASATALLSDSTSKIVQNPQIRALGWSEGDAQDRRTRAGRDRIVPARHRRRRHQSSGQYAISIHRCRRQHRHHAACPCQSRSFDEVIARRFGRDLVRQHRRHQPAGRSGNARLSTRSA